MTPHWVRERKRFDKTHLSLIDQHIYEMTDQIIRSRVDIVKTLSYIRTEVMTELYELRERMDEK